MLPEPTRTEVPFIDLSRTHSDLKTEILEDVSRLIDSSDFVNGAPVALFEGAFAAYCRAAHCIGVGSGLDALRLGLVAANIEPGDEVILPAYTFVATVEAVTQAGGIPVLADVSEGDYNLDADAAQAALGSRARFLLPVHLYGQLANTTALRELANRHELSVIEDACQAHGAERDGARAGVHGLAAAFSFYPAKNLGAMGDAGALVTNDPQLAETVRALREHGQRTKYQHEFEGYTARLDTIQALVLLRKLPHLDAWNAERRTAAQFYNEVLAEVGDLRLPPVPEGSNPVWHLYVVSTRDPEGLAAFLRERGISTGRHYPQPVHLTSAYAHLGYREGAFPVSEMLASHALSLPIFPGISESQLSAVVAAVEAYFSSG